MNAFGFLLYIHAKQLRSCLNDYLILMNLFLDWFNPYPFTSIQCSCHRLFTTLPGAIVGRSTRSRGGLRFNDYNGMDMVQSTFNLTSRYT